MGRDRRPEPRPLPRGGGNVTVDITDGPSVELTKDGYRAVRIAKVGRLKGDGATRLFWAINAIGVPRYGDTHPVIEGLPVSRVHATLASEGTTDIAIVTIEYFYPTGGNLHFANIDEVRESGLPQLEITSTVQPSTTQFATNDIGTKTQITLDYERTDPVTQTTTPLPTQSGTVEYQLPMMVFRFSRREPADAYVGDAARDYVGKVNSVAIFGEAGIRYWMCTRIDGVSDDGGMTYNVTYEFQRHPDSWDATVIYVDPETGQPVPDPVTDIGIKTVQIYRAVDFDRLGLTIPDA